MNINAVIAALGGRFDADEAGVIERVMREFSGTLPDRPMVEAIGMAMAIHRRCSR